jgi:tetratricopeptide (TPR) repeat protein
MPDSVRHPRGIARRAFIRLSMLLLAPLAVAAPLVVAAAPPTPTAPLFPDLGRYRFAADTAKPRAQQYVDQGMLLAYGFNPAEAARSFEAATRIDAACATCWWALAWSLGPNINTDMDPAAGDRVRAALKEARAHAAKANAVQQGLVAALSIRHPRGGGLDEEGYARAMEALARRHPKDAEVALLAAESILNLHPYDWWEADGRPKPWTPRIVAELTRAMALAPDHPGALHYWIHLQESSMHPRDGEAAADRLRDRVPGSGHLVHMPAHIYLRTGRYQDAILANRKSIEADLHYLAAVDAQGAYRVGYVAHNHHFLYAAAAMAGEGRLAIEAANAAWPAACGPKPGDRSTAILQHYYVLPLYALVRFGRWNEILRDTLPPDVAEPYPLAIWHYARGTARARLGQLAAAREDLARLERYAADPALAKARIKNINAAEKLARIAALTLRADIALAERKPADAVPLLVEATAIEDSLTYDEPHLWLAPTRHALGAALLDAGRAADAERVYREDLAHYPDNGWSLRGLALAQKKQGRQVAAQETEQRMRTAFRSADAVPPASRY